VLDDKDVQAVFIATPHYLHGPMAIDAIEAGKHVYCEKAMAYTIGENQDIVRLVKANPRLVFQVGHQRHYSPLYQKVKDLVEKDTIGDVVGIRAQWNKNDVLRRPSPDPALEKLINWRLYKEYSGGLTTEFASHQVDVANWVLGVHPDSVCGYGGVDWFEDGRDTTDNIHLVFNYKVPILERDAYGKIKADQPATPRLRNVRFTYTSLMQNAHLGPSELILGEYGSLEVSLLGGESFKESKERPNPDKEEAVEATVKAGSTVKLTEGGLPRKYGKIIEAEIEADHWIHGTQPIAGAYDREETLLAVNSFLECIRNSGDNKPFADDLKADVTVGLWGSVPALMANIAMEEERTVRWSEFF
jgi:predicted dehydrogenase